MTNQNDPSLDFECPICGAVPKEKCTLYSGGPRFESHLERHDDPEAFQGGGGSPRTLSASLGPFCLNQHGSD